MQDLPDGLSPTALAREAAVAQGVAALDAWLRQALHHGLGWLETRLEAESAAMARRLVDAKAPGLAEMVRSAPRWIEQEIAHEAAQEIAQDIAQEISPGIAHGIAREVNSDSGDRRALLAERLGHLHLIVRAYGAPASPRAPLPAPLAAKLRRLIGWAPRRAEIAADPATLKETGLWRIAGRRVEIRDDGLQRRETWLLRDDDARPAVLIDHAPKSKTVQRDAETTAALEGYRGALAFYPAPSPLRATPVDATPAAIDAPPPPAPHDLYTAVAHWRAMMAADPFLDAAPLAARDLRLGADATGTSALVALDGMAAPMAADMSATACWALTALSAEEPVSAFGLWTGRRLTPLAFWNTTGFWSEPGA